MREGQGVFGQSFFPGGPPFFFFPRLKEKKRKIFFFSKGGPSKKKKKRGKVLSFREKGNKEFVRSFKICYLKGIGRKVCNPGAFVCPVFTGKTFFFWDALLGGGGAFFLGFIGKGLLRGPGWFSGRAFGFAFRPLNPTNVG